MMKLSLCITTYNRPELTIKAFEKVYNDPRIDEIVIVDDCSVINNYDLLHKLCDSLETRMGVLKIKIHRNAQNIGMSRNKARAIELAKNEWCILFDSDNVLDVDYLDALEAFTGGFLSDCGDEVIYCPDFAKPNFDYTQYSNINHPTFGIFGKNEAAQYIKENAFNMLLNTCNYVVNKNYYLKSYQPNTRHIASDTIWHNYNHLKSGGKFYVVPRMQYEHLVHKDSGFMQDAAGNMARAEEVRKLIMQL